MTLPTEPDRWTVEIANAQREEALAAFGVTERQARFLARVLVHSGVFVERQYCSFAGIVHGQKSTDFINLLVERRYATPVTTGRLHRGRMFHVHYKPLWAAIGEPDSRFRKPAVPGRMIERVMILDAVLESRDFVWLGTATDKRRHFTRYLGDRLPKTDYPQLSFGDGEAKVVRYFPDKLPIGVQPHSHPHVLLYLVTNPSPMDFRLFLLRHMALLLLLLADHHTVVRAALVGLQHHVGVVADAAHAQLAFVDAALQWQAAGLCAALHVVAAEGVPHLRLAVRPQRHAVGRVRQVFHDPRQRQHPPGVPRLTDATPAQVAAAARLAGKIAVPQFTALGATRRSRFQSSSQPVVPGRVDPAESQIE